MSTDDIMALLDAQADERGIAHWKRLAGDTGLKSYGLGLTKLRKLGKQIGRDRSLAQALWETDVYDAKVLALLIDDPKQITREQAERQVEQLAGGYLAHVFSSCDATLAKAPIVQELADAWMVSQDAVRRSCGYGLLYEISKCKTKRAPDDVYFLARIAQIEATIAKEPHSVQGAMGTALMGIGKRNIPLNTRALEVARAFGPFEFGNGCEPFDVVKHLTSDDLTKKLGLA
ncbi:MAG: 3-methyladenine DNA glycosylase AlkD [Rhodothermales bacterium]|jgi:3-methyladenine DNA glycosylase AlkD